MKKILNLLMLLCVASTWACNKNDNVPEPEPGRASLSVNVESLEFAARNAANQAIEVTAVNVEWECTASVAWIVVERTGSSRISVSVADNSSDAERSGTITVSPVNNPEIETRTVAVRQLGAETVSIMLSPEVVEFEAEGAIPQNILVEVVGEVTWQPEVIDGDWVKVLSQTKDRIGISVSDNPSTEPRTATLTVAADREDVVTNSITIRQAGLSTKQSLTVSSTAELRFSFDDPTDRVLSVKAENISDWTAVSSDGEGRELDWLHVRVSVANEAVVVSVDRNLSDQPRTGYVVISCDAEGIDDIVIPVYQSGGHDSLGTLTGNVLIDDMNPAGAFSYTIYPNQVWDNDAKATYWLLEILGDGVTHNMGKGIFEGSGTRLALELFTDNIRYNAQKMFTLPDGTYEVREGGSTVYDTDPFTLRPGGANWNNDLTYPNGSWYVRVDEGEFVASAPIAEGSMTIRSVGTDEYEFVFEFIDDAGHTITGECRATLTSREIQYFEEDNPNAGFDDTDPDFGQ